MTKTEWIARCETIFEMGLLTPERIKLLELWLDFVLRYEGVHFGGTTQRRHLTDFSEIEALRIKANGGLVLALDREGYALIRAAAILGHPCQLCAVDRYAWHTRTTAFCQHQEAGYAWHPIETAPINVPILVSGSKCMDGPTVTMLNEQGEWLVETCSDLINIYQPEKWTAIPKVCEMERLQRGLLK